MRYGAGMLLAALLPDWRAGRAPSSTRHGAGALLAALLVVAGACGGDVPQTGDAGAGSEMAGSSPPAGAGGVSRSPGSDPSGGAGGVSRSPGSDPSGGAGSASRAPGSDPSTSAGAVSDAPGFDPFAGAGAVQPPAIPRSGGSPAGAPPNGVVPAPESSAPRPPAVPEELASPEHRRYRQLRVETLRLMIEAARRALPIGPFQERIDAASRTAVRDVSEAGDRMAEIAADLRQAIADSGG